MGGRLSSIEEKEFTKEGSLEKPHEVNRINSELSKPCNGSDSEKETSVSKDEGGEHIAAQTFTFRELTVATKNFKPERLIGEDEFGYVYKGCLESIGQVVAVKQLYRDGRQGNREFLVEVLRLSLLHHPNLVSLIGYYADGDQHLLVYEFMRLGSLENHLHDLPPDKQPLDWNTRMKIAAGAAKGLEYLHDEGNPPVIHTFLKSSNILLDEGYHPKLSDFRLAKLGPVSSKAHVFTRVMATDGYCPPEYAMTGQPTMKSDVYSFGVLFLELITGRKAIDNARSHEKRHLVAWARPLFRDRKKFPKMVDPLLQGHYPKRGLYQALAVAANCLQNEAASRPPIRDVVPALSYLASQPYDPNAASSQTGGVHPSTCRDKNRNGPGGGLHDQDEVGCSGRHGSQSPHQDSTKLRPGNPMPEVGYCAEVDRSETDCDSGRKSYLDELERPDARRESPTHAGKPRDTPRNNNDVNRECALVEELT